MRERRLHWMLAVAALVPALVVAACSAGALPPPVGSPVNSAKSPSAATPNANAVSPIPTATPECADPEQTFDPNDPFACEAPGESLDPGNPPIGRPAPTNFTGDFTWTWEGGDPNSIGGEHHEVLTVSVRLKVASDEAGPLQGSASYDDDGSTFQYDSKVTNVQAGPCTVTEVREGHGTGNVGDDGSIGGLLEQDPTGQWGLSLFLTVTGSTGGTDTVAGCFVSPTTATGGFGAPSLLCDESPDIIWGTWQWETDNTIKWGCHAGDISEAGSLQGS